MRLNENQEVNLADKIMALEEVASSLVADSPVASELQTARTKRETTRGKDVERLGRAVRALRTAARTHSELRPQAREAQAAWQESQQLRWTLAMSAMGVARREASRVRGSRLGREDLQQEAVVGLLEAARRFDPQGGASFGTYARWWVRASLTKAVHHGRLVRIPESAVQDRRDVRRVVEDRERQGRACSIAEAAEVAGVKPRRAERLLAMQLPCSLQEPVGSSEGDFTREDLLADGSAADPAEDLELRQHWERAQYAIEASLDDRSRDILVRRYGLFGAERETLASIAADYGVTPQRVRQIQKKAESVVADEALAA